MKDLLLETDTGEMACQDGDFLTGISDNQHKQSILKLAKGSLKESVTTGVDAPHYLESEDVAGFLREIRAEFTADGMEVKKVGFDANMLLQIDADYK